MPFLAHPAKHPCPQFERLVRAGLGVSLVPRSALHLKVPGVQFHELGLEGTVVAHRHRMESEYGEPPLISRLAKVVRGVVRNKDV